MKIEWIRIGEVENYYGGIHIGKFEGKYYWLIENYCTNWSDPYEDSMEEIPEYLYKSLIRFKKSKK